MNEKQIKIVEYVFNNSGYFPSEPRESYGSMISRGLKLSSVFSNASEHDIKIALDYCHSVMCKPTVRFSHISPWVEPYPVKKDRDNVRLNITIKNSIF